MPVFFLRPRPPREPRRVFFFAFASSSSGFASTSAFAFGFGFAGTVLAAFVSAAACRVFGFASTAFRAALGWRVGFSASRSAVIGSSICRSAPTSVAYAVPSKTRSTRAFTFLPTSFEAFATQTS